MSSTILIGDCRERLKELPDASVDSVVCDPPYHLTSIVKRFGSPTAAPAKVGATGAFARASKGFMGQTWDGGDVAFDPETWAEVLRVLKPGGHLIAFSGTRTYHRMVCAIEDAGFEIRDCIFYCYGSGFPKSHNINKVLHGKELVCDCGSSQVPQRDLRLVPESNVSPSEYSAEERGEILFEGVPEQGSSRPMLRTEPAQGAVNGAQPGLEGRGLPQEGSRQLSGREVCPSASMGEADGARGRLHHGASAGNGSDVRLPADEDGSSQSQGSQPGEQSSFQPGAVADERGSQARGSWPLCGGCGKPIVAEGLGTALKPAVEPICLARKPLAGTVAQNCLTHGTGALNIDGCRIGTESTVVTRKHAGAKMGGNGIYGTSEGRQDTGSDQGRWPANLCHDGSDEVLAGFPETTSGDRSGEYANGSFSSGKVSRELLGDSGSAARFFYCAKATSDERGEGNTHPTVKPVALMRWLVRLVTPRNGTVLDPFMGSGSTLLAAEAEQFNSIGIEMSEEYAAIAERRLKDAGGMFAQVEVSRIEPTEAAA